MQIFSLVEDGIEANLVYMYNKEFHLFLLGYSEP